MNKPLPIDIATDLGRYDRADREAIETAHRIQELQRRHDEATDFSAHLRRQLAVAALCDAHDPRPDDAFAPWGPDEFEEHFGEPPEGFVASFDVTDDVLPLTGEALYVSQVEAAETSALEAIERAEPNSDVLKVAGVYVRHGDLEDRVDDLVAALLAAF